MPVIRGLNVELGDDQNLHVIGTDWVIKNPLIGKGLELDLGQLWWAIWSEDQHNKLDPIRLKAMLLNSAQMSVGRLMEILKEDTL